MSIFKRVEKWHEKRCEKGYENWLINAFDNSMEFFVSYFYVLLAFSWMLLINKFFPEYTINFLVMYGINFASIALVSYLIDSTYEGTRYEIMFYIVNILLLIYGVVTCKWLVILVAAVTFLLTNFCYKVYEYNAEYTPTKVTYSRYAKFQSEYPFTFNLICFLVTVVFFAIVTMISPFALWVRFLIIICGIVLEIPVALLADEGFSISTILEVFWNRER